MYLNTAWSFRFSGLWWYRKLSLFKVIWNVSVTKQKHLANVKPVSDVLEVKPLHMNTIYIIISMYCDFLHSIYFWHSICLVTNGALGVVAVSNTPIVFKDNFIQVISFKYLEKSFIACTIIVLCKATLSTLSFFLNIAVNYCMSTFDCTNLINKIIFVNQSSFWIQTVKS